MSGRPTAAKGNFPYPHRTIAEIDFANDGATDRVRRYAADESEKRGVSRDKILSRSEEQRAVAARRAIMRRLRQDGFSLPQIGRMLNRHHTTVWHALRVAA